MNKREEEINQIRKKLCEVFTRGGVKGVDYFDGKINHDKIGSEPKYWFNLERLEYNYRPFEVNFNDLEQCENMYGTLPPIVKKEFDNFVERVENMERDARHRHIISLQEFENRPSRLRQITIATA